MVACLTAYATTWSGGEEAALEPPAKKDHLTEDDRRAWYDSLKWPRECVEAYKIAGQAKGPSNFWDSAPKKCLVEIMGAGGAYNPVLASMYYAEAVSPPVSRVLKLKDFSKDNGQIRTTNHREVSGG